MREGAKTVSEEKSSASFEKLVGGGIRRSLGAQGTEAGEAGEGAYAQELVEPRSRVGV